MPKKLKVKYVSSRAKAPVRASKVSAGYHLYSVEIKVIKAFGNDLVNTDIGSSISEGTYGRIIPRSGLALKHSVDVGAGVIDSDFRGKIGVIR